MEACYGKTKRDAEEKGAQKRGGSKKVQLFTSVTLYQSYAVINVSVLGIRLPNAHPATVFMPNIIAINASVWGIFGANAHRGEATNHGGLQPLLPDHRGHQLLLPHRTRQSQQPHKPCLLTSTTFIFQWTILVFPNFIIFFNLTGWLNSAHD